MKRGFLAGVFAVLVVFVSQYSAGKADPGCNRSLHGPL